MLKRHRRPRPRIVIPTEISRSDSRRRLAVAVRLLLALLAIWFVATRVDASTIVRAAGRADPLWVALAVALLPVNLALEAATWRPILRRVVGETTFTECLAGVLGGYPIGFFTPGRVGDFAGRALSIDRGDRAQIGISAAVARIPDLAAVLIGGLGVLVAAAWTEVELLSGASVLMAGASGALMLVLSVLFFPSAILRAAGRIPQAKRLESRLQFLANLPARVMGGILCISLARLAVYASQFVFLAFAFSPEALPLPTSAAVLLTFLVKSLVPPVTFLDLGVREGAAAYFFGRLGIGSAVGFDAALMLFGLNLVLPAVVAMPLIARFRVLASAGVRHVAPSELPT